MSEPAVEQSFQPTIAIPERSSTDRGSAEGGPVNMLLKSPHAFAQLVSEDRFPPRLSLTLLGAASGFYACYGLAMGAFTSGNALWMATLKAPLVLLASLAMCGPSLYVLLGLGGSSLTLRQLAGLLAGIACLSSLLMVGFAPVAWLFGVSTYNLQFLVLLHAVVWGVALACGLRLLKLALPGGYRQNKSVVIWCGIFLVVSAQMLTYMRPVLSVPPAGGFREREKRFFFEHFYNSMAGIQPGVLRNAPAPAPAPGITPVPSAPRPMSN